jgi:uncharacterized membrane protein
MHEARKHIHMPSGIVEKLTDGVTTFVGSPLCIYLHTVWFILWFVFRQDINLLTLVVSLEAIYLSTLVMISQNRQAVRDRLRDDLEASEISDIFENHKLLMKINEQQLEMLGKQTEMIELLRPKARTSK